MAGDWIKVESNTPDKPEVIGMADMLGLSPAHVFGGLFMVWRWFDQHTTEGNALYVTKVTVDRLSGVTGFAEAMHKVGWLIIDEGGAISLPNFDRHCGDTAKSRALTAKRVAKHKKISAKSNAKSNAHSVTTSVTSALPREEKRREEIKEKINKKESGAKRALPEKFSVTPEMRAWAESNVSIDIDQATEQWKNSMLAHGRKYVDWGRAWQNGMINAQKWANEKKPPQAQLSPSQIERFVEKAQADEAGIYMATVNGRIYTVSASGRVTAG